MWLWYFENPQIGDHRLPVLLIIDGHFDLEFLLKCKEKGIDVVQEPSNCSSAAGIGPGLLSGLEANLEARHDHVATRSQKPVPHHVQVGHPTCSDKCLENSNDPEEYRGFIRKMRDPALVS